METTAGIESAGGSPGSVFKMRNIRCFIAFRLFFNSRFYYPVFAILFLDFGLTLEHFAVLNTIWAATIVIAEVPSGALADVFGRKRLLKAAGWLMVVEMALLCLAPRGHLGLLFVFFTINRICSGAAEAAASGADESLAYETLLTHGAEGQWGAVLARQMRVSAMGSVVALSLGAAVYDPAFVQRIIRWVGMDFTITQDMTLRIPLILTLLCSLAALAATYRMQETATDPACLSGSWQICGRSVVASFRLIYQAGLWIWRQHFALVVIAAGVVFDNVTRMTITLSSQYFRLIDIPEAVFGIIGAAMAGMGIVVPSLAQHMARRRSPRFNFWMLSGLTLFGLLGIAAFVPWIGLIPMAVLMAAMGLLHFFQSHYLNRIVDSRQRATVLSFRGLSLNLAYGVAGMLFALLLAGLRPGLVATHPEWSPTAVENVVFKSAVGWFPWYFGGLLILLVVFSIYRLRHSAQHRQAG